MEVSIDEGTEGELCDCNGIWYFIASQQVRNQKCTKLQVAATCDLRVIWLMKCKSQIGSVAAVDEVKNCVKVYFSSSEKWVTEMKGEEKVK